MILAMWFLVVPPKDIFTQLGVLECPKFLEQCFKILNFVQIGFLFIIEKILKTKYSKWGFIPNL
jgi:hypothetical protein